MVNPDDIASAEIRYIKLGRKGAWAKRAFEQNELHLGHRALSHDLALTHDKAAIVAELISQGRPQGKASDFAREVLDFYTLPQTAIWVTFEQNYLWWAQAEPDVVWIGEAADHGARVRRTLAPWRNTNLKGQPLSCDTLSSRLTKVASYRQTLCKIADEDYLRRKLIGNESPLISEALEIRQAAIRLAATMITMLHWTDFETFIDLVLARGGWHRSSALGGTQKDADLIVEQTVTRETALVQVKSAANQSTLNDYVGRFDEMRSYDRLIFVCHSPRGNIASPFRDDVILWTQQTLAEAAIRSGLFDWLVARSG